MFSKNYTFLSSKFLFFLRKSNYFRKYLSFLVIFISFLSFCWFLNSTRILVLAQNVQFNLKGGSSPDQVRNNPEILKALDLPPNTKVSITQGSTTRTFTVGEIKANTTGSLRSFFGGSFFSPTLKQDTVISYTPAASPPVTSTPKETVKPEVKPATGGGTSTPKNPTAPATTTPKNPETGSPKEIAKPESKPATGSDAKISLKEEPVEASDILSSGCEISSPKIKWYNLATPGAFLPIIPGDCSQKGGKILALSPVLIPKIAIRIYGLIVSLLFFLLTPIFIIAGLMWTFGGFFGEELITKAKAVFKNTFMSIVFVSMFYLIVFFVFSLFGAQNVLDVDLSQFFTT